MGHGLCDQGLCDHGRLDLGLSDLGRRRGTQFGVKLVLKLRELLLQVREAVGFGLDSLIVRRLGGRGFDECIPLLSCLMQIDGRLAVKREAEQKKSGNRYPGGDGKTQLFPLLLWRCHRVATGTVRIQ